MQVYWLQGVVVPAYARPRSNSSWLVVPGKGPPLRVTSTSSLFLSSFHLGGHSQEGCLFVFGVADCGFGPIMSTPWLVLVWVLHETQVWFLDR